VGFDDGAVPLPLVAVENCVDTSVAVTVVPLPVIVERVVTVAVGIRHSMLPSWSMTKDSGLFVPLVMFAVTHVGDSSPAHCLKFT
jgi:hypothetical protein